jgi:nitrate/nitrite transporter NarK
VKTALVALFGGVAGSAVVWQTAQLYSLFFLTRTLGVDVQTANTLVGAMLLISIPLFILFGWLSDRIGRKPVILFGCLLAIVTYFPLFGALARYANPDLVAAQNGAPVAVVADAGECSFQFNPVGTSQFKSSCDIAKSMLANKGVNYGNEAAPAGSVAKVKIGPESFDAAGVGSTSAEIEEFKRVVTNKLKAAGYPNAADPVRMNRPMML